MEWSVLVPVKRLAAAKTRLRGAVGAERHEPLVLAMAQDTVAAALAAPGIAGVVVVTADPLVMAAVTALGARVVAEPGPGWGAEPGAEVGAGGLNAALRHAASAVVGRIAALPADLPALRGDELSAALGTLATTAGGGYVPDAAGTGTVLLVAAAGGRLVPRFGPGSAAAHGHGGARRFEGDWPSLRHDVDTPADLAVAVALGVGPHTRALLRTEIAVAPR